MDSIIKVLNSFEKVFSLNPANEKQIVEAENELDLQFSKEYRDYLSAFGAASVGIHELTGICSSKRLSVVAVTKNQKALYPSIPKDWYVIEELNIDNVVVWQDKTGQIFQTISGESAKKIAGSLAEYIKV